MNETIKDLPIETVRILNKQLAKKIVVNVIVTTTVLVASGFIANALEKKFDNTED